MRISYRFCFAAFFLFVLSAMMLVSCKDDSSNKPFSLSESKLSLKVAETATIRVSGVSGFTVEMTGNIASYTIDGNVIYVKAEKVGTAALRVLSGSETLECQVTVSENSAQIGFFADKTPRVEMWQPNTINTETTAGLQVTYEKNVDASGWPASGCVTLGFLYVESGEFLRVSAKGDFDKMSELSDGMVAIKGSDNKIDYLHCDKVKVSKVSDGKSWITLEFPARADIRIVKESF